MAGADGENALQTIKVKPQPAKGKQVQRIIPDPWCLEEKPVKIQFEDITSAAFKLKDGVCKTPCVKTQMSNLAGMELYLKKEFLQSTGSYKDRGARNALMLLSEEDKRKGAVTASLGNYAQALCYHGMQLNVPITVFMPVTAPLMKIQKCRIYGSNIYVKGKDTTEAKFFALKMARTLGATFINGYDHPHVLAGYGTMGLEIAEQVPDLDAVIVPIGGGGLLAGITVVFKALKPNVQVIGVEVERCPSFTNALKAGKPVYTPCGPTLADGLAVPKVGFNAFATASKLVDKVVLVKEEWVALSMLRFAELEKCIIEGSSATGLAAILSGQLPELKGKKVVLILTGGNIDTTVFGRCLERGLAADGRLMKFTVTVTDRPGTFCELCNLLATNGANIKDVSHERTWTKADIFSVELKVICETRDLDHANEVKQMLTKNYQKIIFTDIRLPLVGETDES